MRMAVFDKQKQDSLNGIDLSRKGNFDYHIHDLIVYINTLSNFFTTSSCSGRIVVFSEGETKKKGCIWLLSSHDPIDAADVSEALFKEEECHKIISLKYESFILHVQCRSQDDAQNMLKVALDAGYRNSGMVIGKKKKYMVAVRSTHGLEVPLRFPDGTVVSNEYIKNVVALTNERLLENFTKINRFFDGIQKNFKKM